MSFAMKEHKSEWYIIINPHAGSGKTMSEWASAQKVLDYLEINYTTILTNHGRHAETLAYDAAGNGYRNILAVGGDGSLHEAYNGILKWCFDHKVDPEEFYIGVVPIGSGNDWIKSTGVPNDSVEMIQMLSTGSFGKEDVVCVKFGATGERYYMANVGGVGFDSAVCERVNFQKMNGIRRKMIYLNALKYTILHISPIRLQVLADDKEIFKGECYSIAMGVGAYSGGGMRQVPSARLDDGLLDMMIVPKIPLARMFLEIPRLLKGNIQESKVVTYVQAKDIKLIPLDAASAVSMEIDGEIQGKMPLEVKVTGRQINVLRAR